MKKLMFVLQGGICSCGCGGSISLPRCSQEVIGRPAPPGTMFSKSPLIQFDPFLAPLEQAMGSSI